MQLIRPSNVLTAISDVLAGVALGCFFLQESLPTYSTLLCISVASMFLYVGGIVFNDVFDADLDKVERPERPIPSGRISKPAATILGITAFFIGCVLAYFINLKTFYIAIAIVVMCFVYNAKAKHHFVLGPIIMGSCRGLNLLLGISVLPLALSSWYIILVPIVYIAAVTNISRGEVYGNNKRAMLVSIALYSCVILTLLYFTFLSEHYFALVFIFLFMLMIGMPLMKAMKSLDGKDVRKAVKYGVLALILMNACWIAICGFWGLALLVCAILPLSIVLAKKYAVT